MRSTYIQETFDTPVVDNASVIVAGGGIAGIAAALASARNGADTLLIENQFCLGGLATSGLVTIYLPICDGKGHQVIFGIGEELLRLSASIAHEWRYPKAWFESGNESERAEERFEVGFNPVLFAIQVEKLLLDSGVRILYGTKICSTSVRDKSIEAVIIENKSGRGAIETKCVIDATGDADIAHMSGAGTENYGNGNTLAAWYYFLSGGTRKLKMLGPSDVPDDSGRTNKKTKRSLCDRRFTGIDGKEISDMTILSHEQLIKHVMEQRQSNPDYLPINMASIPQLRMTRRILGVETLDKCHDDERIFIKSSIGMTGNWRKRGPIYEIPFGSLCSCNINNLLAAGRDISVTDKMWDITRVIPTCAITGEAAGTAAAISSVYGYKTSSIDISFLQERLKHNGVRLHIDEIL